MIRADHDLDLIGADAAGLLESLGWQVADASEAFRVGGDMVRTDGVTVARLWHAPARGVLRHPGAHATGRFVAMLIVEGRGVCTIDEDRYLFAPGTLLLHDQAQRVALESQTMIAAVHVSHWWDRLLPAGTIPEAAPASSRPSEHVVALLTAIVNVTLSQRLTESDLGFTAWLAAVDSAVIALLRANLVVDATVREEPLSMFDRAMALIAERYVDPAFTIADLAMELGVSTRWVLQAFADAGESPRSTLQALRIAHAHALLPSLPTPDEVADAAAVSGFRSSRALRRALRAASTPATRAR